MKFKYRLIAICLMVVITLCGCEKNGDNTSNIENDKSMENIYYPEPGGTVKLACFVPDTLNPLATQYQNVRDVLMIVYEGLFRAESDLTATPILAKDYSVSTSNKIYTINLKENVRFHDGTEFDSEDVIATFNYIKHYPTPYSEVFKNVFSFKAVGKYTVSIELIVPQLDFACNLDFPILPSGLSKNSFNAENPSFVPIGTGQYKYDGQVKNKYMTCIKYNDNHREEECYIDAVEIKFLHSSKAIFHAFDAGEIDMFTTNGSNWGEFTFTTDVKSFESGSPRYTYMGINSKNDTLKDAKLRSEINAMIDREEIVEEVMFSHAIPAYLPIISSAYYIKKDVQDGGEKSDENSEDNAETIPKKYNHSFYLLYNKESKEKQRTAQYIKKELEARGITIVLQSVDFEEYKKRILEENYDLYIGETIMNNNMNLDFMFNSTVKTDQNICNFTDGQFDIYLNNIDTMTPGEENAEIVFTNFTKYFNENSPQIPLSHTNSALFVSNRVKGETKLSMSHFYGDMHEFFINYR